MRKIPSLITCIVIIVSVFSITAFATEVPYEDIDTDYPSETFINLYTELFSGTETFEVYDSDGVCVTEQFKDSYEDCYKSGDFYTLWHDVAVNGYVLHYGIPEVVNSEVDEYATTKTVYSEYKYEVKSLDSLYKNKTFEYMWRLVAQYTTNGSAITGIISCEPDISVTDPGSMFSYNIDHTSTEKFGTGNTYVTLTLNLTIVVSYAYSIPTSLTFDDSITYTAYA